MSDTGVKSGVLFRVRLQMYPRLELLLVVPMIGIIALILTAAANDIPGAVLTGVMSGFVMWLVVPEASRYRAFGVPLSDWVLDTSLAVHTVALICLGMWAVGGFYLWPFIGILAAHLWVVAWTFISNRHLTRGDRRSWAFDKQRSLWNSEAFISRPGPLPWRIIYTPMLASAIYLALLLTGFSLVMSTFASQLELSGLSYMAAPFTVVSTPVLANSRIAWRAVGLPVRTWLVHAYVASAVLFGIVGGVIGVLCAIGTFSLEMGQVGIHAGQVLLVAALLLLLLCTYPLEATLDLWAGVVLTIAVCIPLFLAVETGDQMASATACVFAAIVIAITAVVVRVTYRDVTAGNRLRTIGPVQGEDRTYYQLQGAGS
jgi:hypothetical protein